MQSIEVRHRDALKRRDRQTSRGSSGAAHRSTPYASRSACCFDPTGAPSASPAFCCSGKPARGKGQLARAIHRAGPSRHGPFVHINCAAIPEKMLEAELFGYERGAFTGARPGASPGCFQTAHGGTLFLDEIGLLPEALQPKLLLAIEERVIRRLGSLRGEPVDFAGHGGHGTAACSPHPDPGRFREDLYYRLSTITLTLPPLREHAADILTLADHFLAQACQDYGRSTVRLSTDGRAALLAYPWPGNVRELANAIERSVLLGDGATITARELNLSASASRRLAEPTLPPLRSSLDAFEKARIVDALRGAMGNLSRAARSPWASRGTRCAIA